MPIELFWDDEAQTVMLAEFSDNWSWDDLHAMLSTIKRLSDERQQIFGAIIDLRKGLNLPGGTIFNREGLNQFQRLLTLNDGGKKGPMVIVGMNAMVRTVFEAVGNFDKSLVNNVNFADGMEEGRQQIYAMVQRMNSSRVS